MQIHNELIQSKRNIALACHIIVDQKLDSGPFGNISIRISDTNTFWVNPAGITFDHITEDDILKVNTNGDVLEGKHAPHPGTFIHREIYRLRPDVKAIVHTHSENTVLISLLGCQIEPFTQLGASIYHDQGIYHGFTGPVRTTEEGTAIAQALGNKSIVIAKNHGLFATGKTIQSALWDMMISDAASKIHLEAKKLGLNQANLLTIEDMEKSKFQVRDAQCEFMWKSYLKNLIDRIKPKHTSHDLLKES